MPHDPAYPAPACAPRARVGRVARKVGATALVCGGLLLGGLSGQAQGATPPVGAQAGTAGPRAVHLWSGLEDDPQPSPLYEGASPLLVESPPQVPADPGGDTDVQPPAPTTPGSASQSPSASASQLPPATVDPVEPAPPVVSEPEAPGGRTAPDRPADNQPGGRERQEEAPSVQGPHRPERSSGSNQDETPDQAPASASPSASASSTAKPSTQPSPPVGSPDDLDTTNAGALSGGRQGDEVTLYLPSGSVGPSEWVAVFTFPQAQGSDWLEVSPERSVAIDVSGMPAGSYKVAVSDSSGKLVGWAQLELSDGSGGAAQTLAKQVTQRVSSGSVDGGDWLLLSAAGVLIAGAVGFVVITRPTPVKRI